MSFLFPRQAQAKSPGFSTFSRFLLTGLGTQGEGGYWLQEQLSLSATSVSWAGWGGREEERPREESREEGWEDSREEGREGGEQRGRRAGRRRRRAGGRRERSTERDEEIERGTREYREGGREKGRVGGRKGGSAGRHGERKGRACDQQLLQARPSAKCFAPVRSLNHETSPLSLVLFLFESRGD